MMEANSPCEDLLLPYFLKELDADTALAFEAHLRECKACSDELEQLQQVWQALPYGMDEVHIPDGVQTQMLDRIMDELNIPQDNTEHEDASQAVEILDKRELPTKVPWYRRRSASAAAVIVLALAGIGTWTSIHSSRDTAHPVVTVPSQVPDAERYVLKSFDPGMPEAKGMAWVERKGDDKQLVLKMNGLQGAAGEQCFQLWVIKEGKRYNGGTFRADANGNAVLTYDLQATQGSFEALGITLEPDAQGVQPRGKKVLGT